MIVDILSVANARAGRGARPACLPQWLVAVCTFISLVFTAFAADPAITVSAQQRYPWNGLVDINFTITGDAGTKYDTSFTAKDMVGSTNITMKTIRKADGTAAATKEQLLPGTYSWVWDAAADLPKDFKCDRVTVTGTANAEPLYMVINLSGGASASSYPVSYLDDVPSGGWSDTYKTTRLVLRRIKKGTNSAGGSMSKDMWVGVFEVTAKQWNLVEGELTCYYGANDIGNYQTRNFSKNAVGCISNRSGFGGSASAFLADLKTRTGVKARLATKSEWQYACRAGTATDYNTGTSATAANMAKIGWSSDNISNSSSKPAIVGLFLPNAWGLYDMHGGQRERTSEVQAVSGAYSKGSYCGGSYRNSYTGCKVTSQAWSSEPDEQNGFRVFADVQ